MKWLAIFLFLISFTAPAQQITRDELIDQIQAKVAEQDKELEFAQRKASEAVANSDRTHEELGRAQAQINQVGKERDGWRDYGNDQHDKWMNAETRVAKEQAAVLRRNLIIGAMSVAIAAYAFLKFYWHLPI